MVTFNYISQCTKEEKGRKKRIFFLSFHVKSKVEILWIKLKFQIQFNQNFIIEVGRLCAQASWNASIFGSFLFDFNFIHIFSAKLEM